MNEKSDNNPEPIEIPPEKRCRGTCVTGIVYISFPSKSYYSTPVEDKQIVYSIPLISCEIIFLSLN